MAATKKTKPRTSEANGGPEPPAGFGSIVTEHTGWVRFRENEPVTGRLVGFEQRYDGDGFQYLIRLTAPALVYRDGEDVVAVSGEVVAMNETHKLKALRPWVHATFQGVPYSVGVWINPVEKVLVKGGRSMWRLDVRVQQDPKIAPGRDPVATATRVADNEPDNEPTADDVPF